MKNEKGQVWVSGDIPIISLQASSQLENIKMVRYLNFYYKTWEIKY